MVRTTIERVCRAPTTLGTESMQILQREAVARGEEIDTRERRPRSACTLPRDLPLRQVAPCLAGDGHA